MIELAAYAVIGALAFRFRGGWPPTGETQIARAGYSLIMAALAFEATRDYWMLTIAPAFFISAFPGWWGTFGPGGNYALRIARGLWWSAAPATVIWMLTGSPWYFAAGLACVPIYEACWTILRDRQTEIAEYAFGAAFGGGLALTLGAA